MPEYKLKQWLEGYFKETGYGIDQNAINLLADSIGNNLEVMTNEIGKMFINLPAGTKITVDHISKYIGIHKDYNNFELTKALGFRNVVKANQIIQYFSQNPKKSSHHSDFFIDLFLFQQAGDHL